MALDGGGGGPVGVTNPFTGSASTLEFIGNGTWAGWSGQQTTTNGSPTTVFDFMSPSQSLKSIINWAIDRTDLNYGSGTFISLEIKFNGTTVFMSKALGQWSDGGYTNITEFNLVIPTRTEVEIIIGTTDGDAIPMTVNVTAQEI